MDFTHPGILSTHHSTSHFPSLLPCSHLCFALHQMASLIQERTACQPLTHFKPDCVEEWEEWMGWGVVWAEENWMAGGGQQRARETRGGVWERCSAGFFYLFIFYDTHLPAGVECSINMLILPPGYSMCWGAEVIYMRPQARDSRLGIPMWKRLRGRRKRKQR